MKSVQSVVRPLLPTNHFIALHKYKEKVRDVEVEGNNRRTTDFTDSTD